MDASSQGGDTITQLILSHTCTPLIRMKYVPMLFRIKFESLPLQWSLHLPISHLSARNCLYLCVDHYCHSIRRGWSWSEVTLLHSLFEVTSFPFCHSSTWPKTVHLFWRASWRAPSTSLQHTSLMWELIHTTQGKYDNLISVTERAFVKSFFYIL